jgi:hypothetical protein
MKDPTKGRPLSSRLLVFAMLAMAVALYSCYPGGATDVTDFDLVVTAFDENFNYKAQQTYAMPPRVILDGDSTQTIDPTTETLILQTVADNMAKLGYTRIWNPDSIPPDSIPDVVVLCRASSRDFAAWASYPWWGSWGWYGWGYYPGWGPGWGWGYPPTGGTLYNYTVGTVLVDMGKGIPDSPADSTFEGIWGAGLNGLLSSSLSADQQRVEDGINQAFKQSPYLDTN